MTRTALRFVWPLLLPLLIAATADPVVARVGDASLTEADVTRWVDALPARKNAEADRDGLAVRRDVVEDWVGIQVRSGAAVRRGLVIDEGRTAQSWAKSRETPEGDRLFLALGVALLARADVAETAEVQVRSSVVVGRKQLVAGWRRFSGQSVIRYVWIPADPTPTPPTADEISDYAARNLQSLRERFGPGATRTIEKQVCARHLVRRVEEETSPDKAPAAQASLAAAQASVAAAQAELAEGASFEAVARRYGEDGAAKRGGDLGCFDGGRMVPEFSEVAFNLPIGEVSGVVRTKFGLHLLQVYAVHEASTESWDDFQRAAATVALRALRRKADLEVLTADSTRWLKTGRLPRPIADRGATMLRSPPLPSGGEGIGVLAEALSGAAGGSAIQAASAMVLTTRKMEVGDSDVAVFDTGAVAFRLAAVHLGTTEPSDLEIEAVRGPTLAAAEMKAVNAFRAAARKAARVWVAPEYRLVGKRPKWASGTKKAPPLH